MRALILAGLFLSSSALAAPADNRWHAKARELLDHAIAFPTVAGRGQHVAYAEYLASQYKAAGFTDVRVEPYEGQKGDNTAALIVRWPAAARAKAKPILLMSHMDVVEAKPSDWSVDPFKLIEKDGYYYGRGTTDIKSGNVAVTAALLKLKAEGFKPKRDLIVFFTGDEETEMNGAKLGATEWRKKGWTDAEYGLNSDGGGGAFTSDGRSLGFGLQTAEKTYQSYDLTVRNRGGHSSRPRPDNAIYELATALKKLEAHRFAPALNETTRAYFTERAKQESGPLGEAMRRWVANPNDAAAADAIEASELEVGTTRTRCVATMLNGGHADNALPQLAQARVNCRILPGVEPKVIEAELKQLVGRNVEVTSFGTPNVPTPVSPLRADVVGAYTRSVQAMSPKAQVIPQMSTGATDGKEFRAVGIPVYGVDGSWIVSPDDERAHGRDERLPVKALDDNVDHWVRMIRSLAG
ncbi:M20/M25/M40 family metallo-hydrolase [Sphingomonas sp.]|jgi:acetylornithine deacetylase/succinyl-diaminopimelate desuccinylase-like protein|uniref:M20/M25/M40 family metallo-hydrolase n=1 Tax=Sphingomonas sp. TaxID=28214 RepID=UPI002DF203BB|nr:M20/M25/M40 family metallo-hydrolase [Sphingomonas sp.]HEV2567297.1 M20/M25/M40 family metallo-hydrolase [Sphingomonas sp.]